MNPVHIPYLTTPSGYACHSLSLQPSPEPNFVQLQTDSLNQEEDPQKLFRRFNIRLIQALPATLKPQFKQRLHNRQPSPQLEQLARQLQDIISIDWDR
ncbi:MAG: hypothetical protein VKN60_12230 [Cyanobacteriota bacterium]|nr:hypothetical protein [Cyanobacteriota bacterium]